MAVKSTVFGGAHLSGSEAEKFQNQVKYGRPKQAAKETVKRGKRLRDALKAHGSVVLRPRNP